MVKFESLGEVIYFFAKFVDLQKHSNLDKLNKFIEFLDFKVIEF